MNQKTHLTSTHQEGLVSISIVDFFILLIKYNNIYLYWKIKFIFDFRKKFITKTKMKTDETKNINVKLFK